MATKVKHTIEEKSNKFIEEKHARTRITGLWRSIITKKWLFWRIVLTIPKLEKLQKNIKKWNKSQFWPPQIIDKMIQSFWWKMEQV